jgi:hypothetical protein
MVVFPNHIYEYEIKVIINLPSDSERQDGMFSQDEAHPHIPSKSPKFRNWQYIATYKGNRRMLHSG